LKLGLSLSGINQTVKNLEEAGIIIPKDFNTELIDQGRKLRDRAREILARESQRRTSQRYWTGKLEESIKMEVTEDWKWKTGKSLSISVGPDMRVAPYAEWIEIGHYLVGGAFGTKRGGWWPGYHYMEGAYTELAPKIPGEITKTLRVSLNKFSQTASKRIRHLKTGRFVSGAIK